MRSGSLPFLVDTNLPVYAYDPADGPKQERAILVLRNLEEHGSGAFSAQVLSEFLTTVTRKISVPLTLEQAEREVANFVRSWPIFDITPVIVLEAIAVMQRRRLSYWDALILATAKLNGVPNVLSEDGRDGAVLEGVRIINPLTPSFDLNLLTGS
jgi:predicted nucleic acid-binding protein